MGCPIGFLLYIFLRHLQQPIYWPDVLPGNPRTYQKAYDSLQFQGKQVGRPKSPIDDIFGKGSGNNFMDDCICIQMVRVNIYHIWLIIYIRFL